MNRCGKCGSSLPDRIKFCTSCGARIEANDELNKCKNCNLVNPKGVKFCTACGSAMVKQSVNNSQGNNSRNTSSFETASPNYSAPAYVRNDNTQGGVYHKKSGRKKLWAGVAVIILICFSAFLFRESILDIFHGTDNQGKVGKQAGMLTDSMEESPAEFNPAPMPVSGTEPFVISPVEGLTISAEVNALDKERTFSVRKLESSELQSVAENFPYRDMLPIYAVEVDAGLSAGEKLPGEYTMEFDLAKLDIPENLYNSVGIVRLNEGEKPEVMYSSIEGSKLVCRSRKNCIFSAILLGTGLGVVAMKGIEYAKQTMSGGEFFAGTDKYKGVEFLETTIVPGYIVYWPENMDCANPDEVKRVNDIIMKNKLRQQCREKWESAGVPSVSVNYEDKMADIKAMLSKLLKETEYKEAVRLSNDPAWQKENLFPVSVSVAIEALEHADEYLFRERKLKKPKDLIEVYMLPHWPAGEEESLGFSVNPYTGPAYMHINISGGNVPQNRAELEAKSNYQDKLNELEITVMHELFHISQCEYVWVDWERYTWFWEATAVLLENEAVDYYYDNDRKWISSKECTTIRDFYELFRLPNGKPEFWNVSLGDKTDKYIQNQGYGFSIFFEFMRDRYYGSRKNDFLPDILKRFGSEADWVTTIIKQTSNSSMVFEADFKLFYAKKAEEMAERIIPNSTQKSPEYADMHFKLDRENPVCKISELIKPLSSGFKIFDLAYDQNKYSSKDVLLVLKKENPEFFDEYDVLLRIGKKQQGRGQYDFKSATGKEYYTVKDVRPGKVVIHDIYSVRELFRSMLEYKVFIMVKPDMAKIEKKEDKLVITLPSKSPLFGHGIVDKYLVTVTDPNNKPIMLETEKNILEVPLSKNGDFTDWDSAEMKKKVSEAAKRYIDSNPGLKSELYSQHGKDKVDQAVDSVGDMDIDYGVLGRAAEVLNGAVGGNKAEKKYTVTVCEIAKGEEPVYGPPSEPAELKTEISPTGGVNIYGEWEGKVQITGQKVTVTIENGKDGYDYVLKISMYGDMEFYGNDNGDGTCTFGEDQGFMFTLIKNSEKELYMTAPPVTLKRK